LSRPAICIVARIYECLPLAYPRYGESVRIIAFILDRSVVERILTHMPTLTVT